MRLPSLNSIISKSTYTFRRFPLAIASGVLVAIVAIYLSELNSKQIQTADHLFALLLVSVLGISLFFTIQLIGENNDWSRTQQISARMLGAGILGAYFFLLPDDFDSASGEFIYRYILYLLAAHLLVAIGPYWGRDRMSSFWQYNKTLFLRFLTAVLFSGVLYIGLIIALGSIDVLLGVDVADQRYFQLFLPIAFIFNTWFFLVGIPRSVDIFDRIQDYPKGLKIFTQNILIPLVIIYVIILYLYTGKIIFEWIWPEGWVAYLILSFSIAGILALLLLHPIREKTENRWIKKFSKNYFRMLVPLVILLLLAIWRRIDEYGFTVNRYFVLLLGLWLAGIVLYFIISKAQNIKVIPASLGITAFLISFGPWGAFSVSEQSQIHRLEQYLTEYEILKENVIQKASAPVPFEGRQEISSILRYLNDTHGIEGLQPWFEEDLSELNKKATGADSSDDISRSEIPRYVTANLMGIGYVEGWQDSEENTPVRQFSSSPKQTVPLGDYAWLTTHRYHRSDGGEKEIELGDNTLFVKAGTSRSVLEFYTETDQSDLLQIDIGPMMEKLSTRYTPSSAYNIPPEEMTVEASNEALRVRIHFSSLSFNKKEGNPVLNSFAGTILLNIHSRPG